jgi:hypothetical protein
MSNATPTKILYGYVLRFASAQASGNGPRSAPSEVSISSMHQYLNLDQNITSLLLKLIDLGRWDGSMLF